MALEPPALDRNEPPPAICVQILGFFTYAREVFATLFARSDTVGPISALPPIYVSDVPIAFEAGANCQKRAQLAWRGAEYRPSTSEQSAAIAPAPRKFVSSLSIYTARLDNGAISALSSTKCDGAAATQSGPALLRSSRLGSRTSNVTPE